MNRISALLLTEWFCYIAYLSIFSPTHAAIMIKSQTITPEIRIGEMSFPARTDTMIFWLSPDRGRLDAEQQKSIIYDRINKTTFTLIHKFKIYMVDKPVDFDSAAKSYDTLNLFSQGLAGLRPKPQLTLVPTDSFETIQGRRCRRYLSKSMFEEMGMIQNSEIWTTTDVKIDMDVYFQLMFGALSDDLMRAQMITQFSEMGGVIMSMTSEMEMNSGVIVMSKSKMKVEVVEIREVDLADGFFEIPAGYELYPLREE